MNMPWFNARNYHSKSYKSSASTIFCAFLSTFRSLVLYCSIVWLRTPIRTSIDFISATIFISAYLIFTTGELSVIVPECSLVFAFVKAILLATAKAFRKRRDKCHSFPSMRRWDWYSGQIISSVIQIGFCTVTQRHSYWSLLFFRTLISFQVSETNRRSLSTKRFLPVESWL
jgi:hypothetical protein